MQIKQTEVSDDTTDLKKESQKIRCPYVHKHRVQPRVFASHIEKCRKALPLKYLRKFATCKYNSLHIFSVYEIGAHQMTCPNRQNMVGIQQLLLDKPRIIQQQISQTSSQQSKKSKKPQHHLLSQSSYFQSCQDNNLSTTSQGFNSWGLQRNCLYASRQEQQDFDSIFNMGCRKFAQQHSQECYQEQIQQISDQEYPKSIKKSNCNKIILGNQKQPKQFKSKFGLQFTFTQLKQIQDIKTKRNIESHQLSWTNKNTINQQNQETKNKNEVKQFELHQCPMCCQILCDTSAKLWKNKKLVKFLKTYSKLENEQAYLQVNKKEFERKQIFDNDNQLKKQLQIKMSMKKIASNHGLNKNYTLETSSKSIKTKSSQLLILNPQNQESIVALTEQNSNTQIESLQILSQISTSKKQNSQKKSIIIEVNLQNGKNTQIHQTQQKILSRAANSQILLSQNQSIIYQSPKQLESIKQKKKQPKEVIKKLLKKDSCDIRSNWVIIKD